MTMLTIVGTQWGDEGKGKIVDLLAEKAEYIVRFQGGNNAGHTLVIGDSVYKLNLLPSGIVRDTAISCIGNGVVIDPAALMAEIDTVTQQGLSITPERLIISDRCHLILPVHKMLDDMMETARGANVIGTTKKGIGPAYEDKVARRGIRLIDLKNPNRLRERLQAMLTHHNLTLRSYGVESLSVEDMYQDLLKAADILLPHAGDVATILHKAHSAGRHIMFEGAQGALLDIDHGTYPFVTASNTVAGQTSAGSGYGAARRAHIIGLAKAYTTRVGSGPFPTEQDNEIGHYLGETGHEFGTVTGRKRRCGWFDAPAVRHACLNGDIDSIALTKLDVLDGVEHIKICVGYTMNGQPVEGMPACAEDCDILQPIYETMEGWMTETKGTPRFQDLPANCQAYINRLETLIDRPISIISTSPERNDTIMRIEFFA